MTRTFGVRTTWTGVVGALVPLLAACGDSDPGLDPAALQLRDSAEIRIVELGSDLAPFARTRADLDRVFRMGDAGAETELFRVASARFLPAGRLAIADAGERQILVVDSVGELVRRLGREGEGPGEFGTITSLHVDPDGSLLAYDDFRGRLTVFGSDGELIGTRPLAEPWPVATLVPLTLSRDGPALAVYGDLRVFARGGIRRDTTPLFRFEPGSTVPDTLGRWGARAWSFGALGQGRTRVPLAFGPDLRSAGRGDRAALADSHAPRVEVLAADGTPVMIVRWEEPLREVTEDDRDRWRKERADQLSEGVPEQYRTRVLTAPTAENHPIVDGVLVDAAGGLWVAPSALVRRGRRTWLRLSREGEPLPAVRLPEDVTPLDAADGRLAVLEKDAFDVEYVTVYRIGTP